LTNCRAVGWFSDRSGYRYDCTDPDSGQGWSPMPSLFLRVATIAAAVAGFSGYAPDVCRINRYLPSVRRFLHQDRNEVDHEARVISVSLGLSAILLFGGLKRSDRSLRATLSMAMSWFGAARHACVSTVYCRSPMGSTQRRASIVST